MKQINNNSSGDENYTPDAIYNIIKNRILELWPEYTDKIIRPFWPGADYTKVDYPEGCLVLDNPPFSINQQIAEYYKQHNIKYILFTQMITGWKQYMPGVILFGNIRIKYSKQQVSTMLYTNLFEGVMLDGVLYKNFVDYQHIKLGRHAVNNKDETVFSVGTVIKYITPGVVVKLEIEEVPRNRHTCGRCFKILNIEDVVKTARDYYNIRGTVFIRFI